MKHALAGVLIFFVLGTVASQGALIKESVIAPRSQADPMAADEVNDPFGNSPVYPLSQSSQVFRQGDLKAYAPEDFQADLRLVWTSEAVYLRFDIADDEQRPIIAPDPETPFIGDYIRVSFRHRTVGANRRTEEPWSVLLFPDLKGNTCEVLLEVPDNATAARVGGADQITTRVFTYQERTSLIVRIPTDNWEDQIRRGGLLKFQVIYYDDDVDETETDHNAAPEIDHVLSYFPIKRGTPGGAMAISQFGEILFTEDVWVSLRPTNVMYPDGKLQVLVDYGNLTNAPLGLEVTVSPDDSVNPSPVKTFDSVMPMPAGTTAQNQTLSLPLEDVPGGRYRVTGRTHLFFDSSPIIVDKPSGHTLLFLRNHIEWQPKVGRRALPLYERRELIKESYRYMAGGGTVLWSAGLYDASSEEFRQVLREKGPFEVNLPEANARDLPWALFGGLDQLDGMNEPLVVKVDSALLGAGEPFQPQMPEFAYLANDRLKKRKAVRSRRLLLLGLAYDYLDEHSFPHIVVKSGRRTVAAETLRGAPLDGTDNQRRVFVLRIWLEEGETQVSISNTAPFGPKAEIDFMAFLGPGERPQFAAGSGSLSFAGSDEATLFSQQLATSMFFMRHYMVDRTGGGYSSLPGGKETGMSNQDFGLLMQELAVWGAQDDARRLATSIPRRVALMRSVFTRQGEMGLGYPSLLIGLHELWRHMPGDRNNFLRRIWLSSVHQPVTDLINNMSRNPHDLVESSGELGVPSSGSAAGTLPMSFASWAALQRASEMATTIGQTADRWERESRRLEAAIARRLIAPIGGLSVYSPQQYPESFGIPAQDTIQAVIPQNVWLYGLYRHGKPVLYNGDIRVFDTPYVLAGSPFYSDANGYQFNDQHLLSAQTTLNYLYIVSPLFQGSQRSFLASNLLDYKNSNVQLWAAYTALMTDNFQIGTKLLNAYIRYTFDEYAGFPKENATYLEISPYTFEEKLNSGPQGENLGSSQDDLNVMSGTLAMRTARLMLGLDDSDPESVVLTPRLPEGWNNVTATEWPICHRYNTGHVSSYAISYERLVNDRYLLTLEGEAELSHLEVRFGPFPATLRRVEVTTAGNRERIPTTIVNGQAWATTSFRNISKLEVTVKPSF